MAKDFWNADPVETNVAPVSGGDFWSADPPAAKQDLPADVKPSLAGAGRGFMVPPSQPVARSSFQPDNLTAEYGDVAQGLRDAPAERPVSVLQTEGMNAPPPSRRLGLGAGPISQQTAADAEALVDGRASPERAADPVVQRAAAGIRQQVDAGQRDTFGAKLERTQQRPTQELATKRTADEWRDVGEWASDTGAALVSGAVSLAQLPVNIIAPGSALSESLQKSQQNLQDFESEPMKARRQELADRVNGEEGFLDQYAATVAELVSNPSVAIHETMRQAAMFAGVLTAARGGAAAAQGGVALAGRASPTVALGEAISGGAIAARAGTAGATAGGIAATTTMAAGDAAGNAYEKLMSAPPGMWEQSEDYQNLIAKGVDPEAAKQEIATAKARTAAMIAAPLGLLGFMGAEASFVSRGAGRTGGQPLRVAATEMITEPAEEALTTVAGNYAAQTVNPEQELGEGAGEAAGMATVTSGPFAAAGAINEMRKPIDRTEQIKALRAAGDTTAADMLKRRFDREMATFNAGSESQRLADFGPAAQDVYRQIRMSGAQPGDAVVKTAIRTGFEQAAQMAGLSPKAKAALDAKLETVPPDRAPAVVQKYITALAEAGAAQPFEGLDTLAGDMESQMDAMLDAVIAGSIEPTTEGETNEAEQTTATEAQADTAGTVASTVADDVAPGQQEALDALSDVNDILVTPETDAVHQAATSPLNDLPDPSQAQKNAGNYKLGKLKISGLNISVENPQGSVRRGTDEDGKAWESPMRDHYGYIRGTTAADGDKLDLFIKPGTPETFDGTVFVVDQIDPKTGKFDEAKVVMGAADENEAEAIYRRNYSADWQGLGAITALPMTEFKAWAASDATKKPLGKISSEQTNVQDAPQGTARAEAQAAPVEAPTAAGGDGATTSGVSAEGGASQAQADGVTGPVGRDSVPIAEGGKPFRTKNEADKARKLQPTMRVVKSGKGFALAPKTPAQIEAQKKAAKRLGGVGNSGVPMAAHELLASRGGLSKEAMADLGFDRNQKVGAKWLFAGTGGLSLERATEALQQAGYMQGTDQGEAIAMIQRSARGNPVYTPDGYEQMAQAEAESRFEDYLAAQDDPFGSLMDDGYEESDVAGTGFEQASPEIQAEVAALSAQMEAIGRDPVDIVERLALQYPEDTQKEFHERAKAALTEAVAEATQPAGRGDSGQDGSESGSAPTEGEGQGLTLEDRPDGTLAVRGDSKALRERLTAAGIPARSILPSATGVVVGKTQAKAAREALQPVLTTPTRSDVEAQQDRAEQADKLDERAQVKRESEVGDNSFMTGFDGDGRQDTTGNLFANEPGPEYSQPYETDLFGEALPASNRAAAKAARTERVRGDAQPASSVPGDTPAPAGEYNVRTVVGTEVKRKLGASRINSYADLAQATQYLYKSAVERFDAIVTDNDGKPLAVVGGFKGAVNQVSVYAGTIIGEAVRVPGAGKIWLSHNHPSGTAKLSEADKSLNQTLVEAMAGSGVEPMGLIAVAGAEYAATDGTTGKINPAHGSTEVPVIERELIPAKGDSLAISSPTFAKGIAKTYYERADAPGIILLDSQNRVSAWIPIPENMRGYLRYEESLNAIYRAVSESNAAAAIIAHGGELDATPFAGKRITSSQNIMAALRKVDVRPLDTINVKTNEAQAETGMAIEAGPLFSRSQSTDSDAFKRWFGDSKVVDEQGKPLMVYHGTNKDQQGEAFTMLDAYASNYGLFGQGAYLTADPSVASEYTSKGRGDSPSVYPLYASIKNPIDMDADADPQAWANAYPDLDLDAYHEGGTTNESYYRAAEEALRDEGVEKWEGAEAMQDGLRRMGHDGITHIGGGRVRSEGKKHRVFIAFDPEQIKSATGNRGTFDPNDPDIRFSQPLTADLFRQMTTPMARGMKVDEVRAAVAAVVNGWKNGPPVNMVADVSALPMAAPADVHGVYHQGQVYLVASNIGSPTQAKLVLAHEAIAHHGLREMQGAESHRQFMNQIQLALKAGNKPLNAIKDEVRRAYVGEDGKFNLSPEQEADEIAARVVEQAVDADGKFRPGFGFVKAVYARIAEFLRSIGFNVTLTMVELQGALVNAQRNLEAGKRMAGNAQSPVPVFAASGDQRSARALEAISRVDEMFELPKSDKTDLRGIADDILKGIKIRETKIPGNETMYTLTMPDDTIARLTVRKSTADSVYGATDRGNGEGYDWITGRPGENPEDVPDGTEDLWIDVSALKQKQQGTAVYNIAAAFAHNTGRIFIGDPSGLSTIALRRRTEQMLSSALKYGTTDHLAPHPDQVEGNAAEKVPGLRWVYGDSVGNIERMIDVTVKSLENASPNLGNIRYDIATGQFVGKTSGQPIPLRVLAERAGAARRRAESPLEAGQAGWRTVARAVLFRDLRAASRDRNVGSDGGSVLALLRGQTQRLRDSETGSGARPAHQRIFYSRSAGVAQPATKAPAPSPVTAAPATPAQIPLPATQGNPPPRAPVPEESRARAAQRVVQDQFNRFTVIRNWAKEQGMNLSQISDVWGFEERMHGRIATRVEDFREKRVQPLIQRIQKAGFTMPQVAEYLHAQHAEERNKQIQSIDPTNPAGSGMTTADAKVILAAAKPELVALANEFRNIADDTKTILLNGGIISQEMVDAWDKTYKHYVPLKGGDQDTQPVGTGKGLSVKATNKRALGHGERSEFIVENMLRDHERAVMLVEKNRVGHSLLAMTVELGRDDIATFGQPERRKVLKNATSFEVVGRNGAVVGTFDSQQAANAFIVTQKRAGLTVRQVKGDPVVSYMASPMLAENEVQVYVKGQVVRIQLNDPLLARGYKKLGVEHLGRVMQANREINGMISKVYTAYNPEFFIKNVLRDFTSGIINITGQEGALIATKAAARYPQAFGQMLRYSFSGGKSMSPSIKAYREQGGTTGAAYLSDIERVGADIQAAYEKYQGALELASQGRPLKAANVAGAKMVRLLVGFMEHLNAAGENAMRLAVFDAVRNEPGRTIQEAASLAKNSTVNFNRKGEMGAQANALYLFFNAAMQGTAATLDALLMAKHRHQAQAVAGALGALAYSLAALQFGGDDEEDREAWEKIPDHVKDRNLVIRTGEDTYITLAVPYGYGFFFTAGNAAFDLQRGADKDKIALKLASGLVEHFGPAINPISGDDLDPKGLVELVPGLVGGELTRAGARAVVNRSGLGGEIVPESPFDEGKPDNLKMYRSTKGTGYEAAASMMNQITGGTKSQPGMIDVSPETLKFWTQTVTGGAGKFVMDSVNTATLMSAKLGENDPEALNALTPDIRETPLIRTVVRKQDIRDTRRVYWEKVKEAEEAQKAFNRAKKMGDADAMVSLASQEGHLLAMAKHIKKTNEAVKALRDTVELINLSDEYTRAEKRMMVKDLERGEEDLYNGMIRVFRDMEPD